MRLLKILLIVTLLVGIIGGGLGYFLMPSTIDWNDFTAQFTRKIQQATGRAFQISGKPVFTVGTPSVLKTEKVVLKNRATGTYPDMLIAPSMEMTFDSKALLRRKVIIEKITLNKPEIFIEQFAKGDWNFYFGLLRKETKTSAETVNLEEYSDDAFYFNSILFSDGTLHLKGKGEPEKIWNNFSAEMFAESIIGPFSFEGTLKIWGGDWRFSLKTSKLTPGENPRFSLSLINVPSETVLRFNGGFDPSNMHVLDGSLDFDLRKPELAYAMFFPERKLPKALSLPLSGTLMMRLDTHTQAFTFKDILFKFGNLASSAQLSRSFVNGKAVVKGNFNVSQFNPEPFFQDLKNLTAFITQWATEKKDESVEIDFNLDTFEYKKDNVRSVKFKIHNRENLLTVSDFTTTLPGGMVVSGKGSLSLDGEKTVFLGDMSAETENLLTLLRWLNVPYTDIASQNLFRTLKAKSDFKITDKDVFFSNVLFKLDLMNGKGAFGFGFDSQSPFFIQTSVNDVNFDAYFPDKKEAQKSFLAEWRTKSPSEKVKSLFAVLNPLNALNVIFDVHVDLLTLADVKMQKVLLKGNLNQGILTLDKLQSDDLFNSVIGISGMLTGFGAEPSFPEEGVRLFVETKKIKSLAKETGFSLPAEYERFTGSDKLDAQMSFAGNLEKLNTSVKIKFDDFFFDGSGVLEKRNELTDFNISVHKMTHTNLRNFIRFFEKKYRPISQKQPEISFVGAISRKENAYNISLKEGTKIEDEGLTGSILIDFPTGKPMLFQANLDFEDTIDISPFLPDMKIREQGLVGAEHERFFDFLKKKNSFKNEAIDFSFLGNYQAKVTFKVPRLLFEDSLLTDVDGLLTLDSKKIHVELSKALWRSADLILSADVSVQDQIAFDAKGTLTNLASFEPLFDFSPLDFMFEKALVSFAVNGKGTSASTIFENLEGRGSVSIEKLNVLGLDAVKASDGLNAKEIISKTDFLTATTNGETVLKNVSLPFEIKEETWHLGPMNVMFNDLANIQGELTYQSKTQNVSGQLTVPLTKEEKVPLLTKTVNGNVSSGGLQVTFNNDVVYNAYTSQTQEKRRLAEEEEKRRLAEEEEKRKQALQKRRQTLKTLSDELKANIETVQKQTEKITQIIEKGKVVETSLLPEIQKKMESLNEFIGKIETISKNDSLSDEDVRKVEDIISGEMADYQKNITETYEKFLIDEYSEQMHKSYVLAGDYLGQMIQKSIEFPTVREPLVKAKDIFDEMEILVHNNDNEKDIKKLGELSEKMTKNAEKVSALWDDFYKQTDLLSAKKDEERKEREKAREEEKKRLEKQAEEKAKREEELKKKEAEQKKKEEKIKAPVEKTVIQRREGSRLIDVSMTNETKNTEGLSVEKESKQKKTVIKRHEYGRIVDVTHETEEKSGFSKDFSIDVMPKTDGKLIVKIREGEERTKILSEKKEQNQNNVDKMPIITDIPVSGIIIRD